MDDLQSWAQGQVGGGDAQEAAPAPGADGGGEEEMSMDVVPLPELAENVLALRDSIDESIKDLEDKSELEDLLSSWEDLATKLEEKGKELAELAAQEAEDAAAKAE